MPARAGLYLHVPFCPSICPYCDFSVLVAGQRARLRYLEGVETEIGLVELEGWGFDTLYLGGGTPSSLAPDQLQRVLAVLRRAVDRDVRLFLEVNPEDVSEDAAAAWKAMGFDFVSLGVQSLDDRRLAWLGRRHSAATARTAFARLRGAGFWTVSLDLIYGSPGDDPSWWRAQLEAAVALQPDHLSCYQLTVNQRTVFGRRRERGRLVELPEEGQAELFRLTHRVLADLGFEGYEVSNFARTATHRSSHNQKYWRHHPYLGLGPAAHSFAGNRRWWNRPPRQWQAAVDRGERPVDGSEELAPADLALEALMLGLRTADGVDLDVVRERWGVDLAGANAGMVDRLVDAGLLRVEGPMLRPTLDGMAVADALARAFSIPG